MADIQWFRIRSWHAVRLFSDRVGHTYAYCGKKQLDAEIVDTLPTEKSCESCLRILARKVDA
jgi:hypothetical protein